MVSEPPLDVRVDPGDLAPASAVSQVARALDAPEIVEYWKSAPYLLNFMRHYSLKRLLEQQASAPSAVLRDAMLAATSAMRDRNAIDAYEPLDQIGRAHVCTPVTNAHILCRLLHE